MGRKGNKGNRNCLGNRMKTRMEFRLATAKIVGGGEKEQT